MNKEKAIEYIKRAKEQLSYDLLTIRLCEMARNNLQKALKELEDNMEQNNKQTMPDFELGNLYVFNEEDEDGELTIIGKLIAKNESQDTLTFGNQYEIETENFVTDQAFDLRISTNKELREATDEEAILFQNAFTLWKKSKEHPSFKTFDKVLVRNLDEHKWRPAIFVQTRISDSPYRYNALLLISIIMESEKAKSDYIARQREYYLKHRDKMLAYSRKYIKDHPEKQKLYRENAAKKRANGTGYYQRYYQRNKEKLLEKSKSWRQNHPRKGEGVPAQILSEEKRSSKERKEDNAESRYR